MKASSIHTGSALVIVLALVVLLSGLVVAYLTRSMWDQKLAAGSVHQAVADELARSALEIVTLDLKQEIVNGSDPLPNPNPNNYPVLYSPKSAAGFTPVKHAPNYPAPTLIRVSRSEAIPAPGADHPASDAISTAVSANGRNVTPARWNKHYLLPLADPAKPTDTTPRQPFTAPSWVFVSPEGPVRLSEPDHSVIGRYAYAVYDEGALLDVNVAGYPSALPYGSGATMPAQYSPKGSLAFADLTQLKDASGNSWITGAGINNLAGWRGYASLRNATAQPSDTFPNLSFTGSAVLAPFRNLVLGNANGFLKVSAARESGGQGDQAFLSRQDLIGFCLAAGTADFNPNALQYLGTFSRAINAPALKPPVPTSVNPDLAALRFPNAAVITHYKDDGTFATYDVAAGDPLLQTRFSLARLGWLGRADPDTGTAPPADVAAAIRSCFGLAWDVVGDANGGNPCWNYVGSAGSFDGTIKTLDQVVAEEREPNFFELLKAAILDGSLGLHTGPCAYHNASIAVNFNYHDNPNTGGGSDGIYAYSFDRAGTIPSPARISDLQIIRIGAGIIDQYDSDSWPTAICFQYAYPASATRIGAPYHGSTDIFGPVDLATGVENIPYLQGMMMPACTTDGQPSGDGVSQGLALWWQPQLWNPHQKPNPANSGTAPPTTFQIRGFGRAYASWAAPDSTSGATPQQSFDGKSITFTDSAPATSAFYENPTLLRQSGATGSIPNVTATASIPEMLANPQMADYASNPFVGFWAGTDVNYNPTLSIKNARVEAHAAPVVSFCLGWIDSGGRFHPYSWLTGIFARSYGVVGKEKSGVDNPLGRRGSAVPLKTGAEWHLSLDPRTGRLASLAGWQGPHSWMTNTFWPGYPNYRFAYSLKWGLPNAGNFSWTSATTGYWQDWAVNQPAPLADTGATATYYADPDGVTRPGDAVFGNATTGDGMPLFIGQNNNGLAKPTGPPFAAGDNSGNTQHGRRSIILNRPFRSVGELGYVFRDQPFKTLDFFSTRSADVALLDLFSVREEPSTSAGQVNLSNAPAPVIRAILAGASKKDFDPAYNLTAQQSETIAANIANGLSAVPLTNRADLISRLGTDPATGVGPVRDAFTSSPEKGNKAYLEAPVRALGDVVNTRTWNLLIDIVAQGGTFRPNAPKTTAALNSAFVVQGERRYWLHIAIDRITGRIIDRQWEPVYE